MKTIHATEAAEAAINIDRVDWIHGAAELILNNQVQYDRSTSKSKEAFISLDNVMEDVMNEDKFKVNIMDWLAGGECCDHRDEILIITTTRICILLTIMADDFNIGVE